MTVSQDAEGSPAVQSVGQLTDEQGLFAKTSWNGQELSCRRRDRVVGRLQGSVPQLLEDMSMRSRAKDIVKRSLSREVMAAQNAALLV